MRIDESLVALNMQCRSREEVLKKLCDLLYQEGAVGKDFFQAAWEREESFPTGLPTEGVKVALPHPGTEYVNYSALAVGILKNPVEFRNMANPDEILEVEMVFLLANDDPKGQVDLLKRLALLFGQPDKLAKLKAMQSPSDVVAMLKTELSDKAEAEH